MFSCSHRWPSHDHVLVTREPSVPIPPTRSSRPLAGSSTKSPPCLASGSREVAEAVARGIVVVELPVLVGGTALQPAATNSTAATRKQPARRISTFLNEARGLVLRHRNLALGGC